MKILQEEACLVKWTADDIKFLCPSLSSWECHDVLRVVKYKLSKKVNAFAWESLELALAQLGYEVEGKKCE